MTDPYNHIFYMKPDLLVRQFYDGVRFSDWTSAGTLNMARNQEARMFAEELRNIGRKRPAVQVTSFGIGAADLERRIFQMKNMPRISLTGYDMSPNMLRQARQNLQTAGLRDFVLLEADIASLSLPQRQTDAVLCQHVLCHIPDDQLGGMIGQVTRSLRPGGRFIFSEITNPNERMRPSVLYRYPQPGDRFLRARLQALETRRSQQSLWNLVVNAGLKVIRVENFASDAMFVSAEKTYEN